MTDAPVLNGQIIGETENAIRAVMDRLLADTDTTFHQWVVLNGTALSETAIDRDQLVRQAAGGLKVDQSVVRDTLDELVATGLLEVTTGAQPSVRPTDAGRARHGQIRAGVNDVTTRFYDDIPHNDLVTAGQVLGIVKARADAELASA